MLKVTIKICLHYLNLGYNIRFYAAKAPSPNGLGADLFYGELFEQLGDELVVVSGHALDAVGSNQVAD